MEKHEKKTNEKIPKKDLCQTPPYALDPIIDYLGMKGPLEPMKSGKMIIWEPAAGEGYLSYGLMEAGFDVVSTDIINGQDFLRMDTTFQFDAIVTNPPFSLKYKFMARCYKWGKPFALLMPVEVFGAVTAQRLFQEYGFEVMLLNKRVDFKMPNMGWGGSGAWFPVAWFCWKLLPETIMFGEIDKTEWREKHNG